VIPGFNREAQIELSGGNHLAKKLFDPGTGFVN
jgi:hypothetical protein